MWGCNYITLSLAHYINEIPISSRDKKIKTNWYRDSRENNHLVIRAWNTLRRVAAHPRAYTASTDARLHHQHAHSGKVQVPAFHVKNAP